MPPPPPPGDQPPPPPSLPSYPQYAAQPYGPGPLPAAPPIGYAYGQPVAPKNSGMAIAGFVLSVVGAIPCFWFWFLQIPGYLGVIFSMIGMKATKGGLRKGRGLAIAGLVVGLVVTLFAIGMTVFVYTSDNCVTDGLSFECTDF
jgi:hypothetical protein